MLPDVLEIEHEEASLDAMTQQHQAEEHAQIAKIAGMRQALAAKMGDGAAVMKSPGDPTVILSLEGRLHAVAVTYLTQPAPVAAEPAPDATPTVA